MMKHEKIVERLHSHTLLKMAPGRIISRTYFSGEPKLNFSHRFMSLVKEGERYINLFSTNYHWKKEADEAKNYAEKMKKRSDKIVNMVNYVSLYEENGKIKVNGEEPKDFSRVYAAHIAAEVQIEKTKMLKKNRWGIAVMGAVVALIYRLILSDQEDRIKKEKKENEKLIKETEQNKREIEKAKVSLSERTKAIEISDSVRSFLPFYSDLVTALQSSVFDKVDGDEQQQLVNKYLNEVILDYRKKVKDFLSANPNELSNGDADMQRMIRYAIEMRDKDAYSFLKTIQLDSQYAESKIEDGNPQSSLHLRN